MLVDELIALEKSVSDPWFRNDIGAYLAMINDETTYFDPATGRKLIGEEIREFFRTVYEGNIPSVDYEITNPSVVVRGDIVVFTFHVDCTDPASGEPAGRWMITKVLERTADGWTAIHMHFGRPDPPPEA